MRRAITAAALCALAAAADAEDDSFAWLEDNSDPNTLTWVREQNERAADALTGSAEFSSLNARLSGILQSQDRIPYVIRYGDRFYNFWRDAASARGVWRRADFKTYRRGAPVWETLLELDALSAAENENWVWRGANCLGPEYTRCLLHLSRGGGDAVVVREFDLNAKSFVTDGFTLPEAKSRVAWRDLDRLYVSTDFGPGSLTQAGYPRVVKIWTRGTALGHAMTVFEGQSSDVSVAAFVTEEPGYRREYITRLISGDSGQTFIRRGNRWLRIELPGASEATTFHSQLLVRLHQDWPVQGKTYPAGSLLAIDLERFIAGDRSFRSLFKPEPGVTLAEYTATRTRILVNVLDNLRSRLYSVTFDYGRWRRDSLPTPPHEAVSVSAVDEFTTDQFFLTATGFLTPTALYLGSDYYRRGTLLRQMPAQFDAKELKVTVHRATSKDGTRVPYFVVARKGLALDGSHATLLTGYGGFEIARTPQYDPIVGAAWLERGGVYVVANIRGGGEFGPAWHQAALRERRQNAYDDFIAVAEDLIARKITSPKHLGLIGNSNGGLLVAAVVVQRPELFGAAVCNSPLLDMRRYHLLSAGASWIAEYGDPDKPEDWAYLVAYSPYQNVQAQRRYPPMLFTTSLHDDRVHPGHARKMVARMQAQGHEAWFHESAEGGHTANSAPQSAYVHALAYSFLLERLR